MVLTKEEKKAKKAAKRLALLIEEETARKKAKQDELVREMAAHAKGRKEIDDYWYDVMVKIKEPVFRKELQILKHCFERTYDKKDHIIDFSIHLKSVADEQYQQTVRTFCDTIDNIINKFLADLETMKQQNDFKTVNLFEKNEEELNSISKNTENSERHIKLLLYHTHKNADSQAWTTRGENMVKKDEETSKFFEIREDLTSFLENYYSNTWDQYRETLKTYVVRTAENQKNARILRRKQNMITDIIASQGKKIVSSDGVIRRLRTELSAYESGDNQAAFRDRRSRHREACHRLKKCFNNGMDIDFKQLATLVNASNDSLQWLDSAHKKGEKVLQLAALCRKLETHHEKILPFGTSTPPNLRPTKINLRQMSSDDSLVLNAISTTDGLIRLWQRISKAELSKRALYREKLLLECENAVLESQLEVLKQVKAGPNAIKCPCVLKTPQKSLQTQPNAVEGSLEFQKHAFFY